MDYFQATVYQIAKESAVFTDAVFKELALTTTLLNETNVALARKYKEFARQQPTKRKRDTAFLLRKYGLEQQEEEYSLYASLGLAVNAAYDFLIILNYPSELDSDDEWVEYAKAYDETVDLNWISWNDNDYVSFMFTCPGDYLEDKDLGEMEIRKLKIEE